MDPWPSSRSSIRSSSSESQGGRIRTGGLKLPEACGLARLSHALIVPASSPCGSRTHLSALKGRDPRPIDERATSEWAGWRSNPRLPVFNRPLDRLSYRPIPRPNEKARCLRHTGPETPREGCPWPGVTSARDRARAGSPVDRRIASLPDNPGCDADSRRTWTTSVQGMSQTDSTGDRARPPGPSSCTLTDAAPRGDVRAISRRFSDRLSRGTPHGDEPNDSPSEGSPSGLRSNSTMTNRSGHSTLPAAAYEPPSRRVPQPGSHPASMASQLAPSSRALRSPRRIPCPWRGGATATSLIQNWGAFRGGRSARPTPSRQPGR